MGDAPYVVADNTLSSRLNSLTKRSLEDMRRDGWKKNRPNCSGY